MLYGLGLSLPVQALEIYKVVRKTVWRVVDEHHILVLITEGEAAFSIEGREYVARAGDAVFVPAGQQYTRNPLLDAQCTFIYFHFSASAEIGTREAVQIRGELSDYAARCDSEMLADLAPSISMPDTVYLATLTAPGGDAIALGEHALGALYDGRPEGALVASLDLMQILCMVMTSAMDGRIRRGEASATEEIPPKLRRAIGFIRRNYTMPLSLRDLCAHVNISPQHMIRLFKKELGVTPQRYINSYKLSRAHMLIRSDPDRPMKEIAYELGFENPHYFSRLFTHMQGETPSAYRERLKRLEHGSGK